MSKVFSLPLHKFDELISKYSPEVKVLRIESHRTGIDKRGNVIVTQTVYFEVPKLENMTKIDTFLSEQ